MSLKTFTLNQAVLGTVRRGDSLATKRLANLNFGVDGPRALDGTLPLYYGPILDSVQEAFSANYNFDLDAKVQVGRDMVDGRAGIDTTAPSFNDYKGNNSWRLFFSTDPSSVDPSAAQKYPDRAGWGAWDSVPSLFIEEGIKVYASTLGIDFIINPQNLDADKSTAFLGVNGMGNVSIADTETREPFLTDYGGGQVAAFSYVNLPWYAGSFADLGAPNTFNDQPPELYNLKATSSTKAQVLAHSVFKNTVHELGHVFGLQHPGNYNGVVPKSSSELIWNQDSFDESLMSYVSQDIASNLGVTETDGVWLLNLTPRTLDFLALDSIYSKQVDSEGRPFGTSRAFNGDTRYGFGSTISEDESVVYASLDELYNYRVALTIADGSGIDTLDFSGYSKSSLIDLYVMTGDEYKSRFSQINGNLNNLSLAVGTVIENAIGGFGDDILKDNQFNNVLLGNGGNDSFEVSSGSDIIIGGSGLDQASLSRPIDDFLIGHLNPWTSVLRSKDGRDQVVLNGVEKVSFQSPIGDARTRYFSVDSLLNLESLQLTTFDKGEIEQQLAEIGILAPNQYSS